MHDFFSLVQKLNCHYTEGACSTSQGEFMSIWSWFDTERSLALQNNDLPKLQLVGQMEAALQERSAQHFTQARTLFQQGIELAKEQNNACWELVFLKELCEMLFYEEDDLQEALKRIVHLNAIAHDPRFEHCPGRPRMFFMLADIYYERDPFGNKSQIEALLDYLDTLSGLDSDTAATIQHLRAELLYHEGQYEEATRRIVNYISRITGRQRLRDAYRLLRKIAYAQGNLVMAYGYAKNMQKHALNSRMDMADSKLWQAVLAKRLGDDKEARSKFAQGIEEYRRYHIPRWLEPYDAEAEYLELEGQLEVALTVRDRQVEAFTDYGSLWYLSHTYLQRLRLLGRMGAPLVDALADARKLAREMKDSSAYQAQIQRIQAGDFYEFTWQQG